MGRQRSTWGLLAGKPVKLSVSDSLKAEVQAKANALIENVLRPRHIKPPPAGMPFNHIIDFGTKWYRNYFYFVSTYTCPGPNAISPTFESKFARMEHVGNSQFALAYMRHTGEWVVIYDALFVDECIKAVEKEPFFEP